MRRGIRETSSHGSQRLPSRRDFRRMPTRVLSYRTLGRAEHRDYARFYGNFTTMVGKLKRFSFQVRADTVRNNKMLYQLIKATCGKILRNQVPVHTQGQTFSSFGELFRRTPWIRVRKVRNYKVGMKYG
jgi:hypothetical protein